MPCTPHSTTKWLKIHACLTPGKNIHEGGLPGTRAADEAVKMPGRKTPEQSVSTCSMVVPSTTAALGPCFSGSVVAITCNKASNVRIPWWWTQ